MLVKLRLERQTIDFQFENSVRRRRKIAITITMFDRLLLTTLIDDKLYNDSNNLFVFQNIYMKMRFDSEKK